MGELGLLGERAASGTREARGAGHASLVCLRESLDVAVASQLARGLHVRPTRSPLLSSQVLAGLI